MMKATVGALAVQISLIIFDVTMKTRRLIKKLILVEMLQNSIVSKQSAVFASLERLFSLHSAILLESRALKTVLFYVATSIFIYMSTSMKQTYNARPLFYCGLLLTFAVELWILRSQTAASRGLHQTLLLLIFPRLTYGLTTIIILLYHTFNYRDYAMMSYEILLDLQELFKGLPPSLAKPRIEKICEHSVAPLSKIKRCSTESYERMLSKKILRRAQRACPSNPLTWLFPSRTSSRVCGEESCPDKSIDNQAQVHDGFQDPDSMPPIDVVSPLTPCHSYNLRP